MKKSNVKEYNGFKEGKILSERIGNTNRYKSKLCKGIYIDENYIYHAAFQYIDKKATRQNKKVTVLGKSPFWFEKI